MCSSYRIVYLLEPILSTNTPRHKQLFSDVVHRSQRGLTIHLRRVMPSLLRSQRQLLHTTQKRQQRPAGDNVKSGGDAVLKLESASRRTQDSTRTATKSTTEMATTSHVSLTVLSIQIAHSRPLPPPLSTDDTLAALRCCYCDPRFS